MTQNTDYIVRATAAGGQIRAFAATTRDLVEEARAQLYWEQARGLEMDNDARERGERT